MNKFETRPETVELKGNGMLLRLKVDCLRHCHFVHSHHDAEDIVFFPELRETNPAMNPVIDRLEADHRRVSQDLDVVEAAAKGLSEDESRLAREAVAGALRALGEDLLAYLAYEERNVEATVLRLREHAPSPATGGDDGAA